MAKEKLQPWADAQTVGPPLIRYLKERKYHGEVTRKDQKDIVEAFSALRALNKSWYLEVTGYIQKLSVSGAQQLEQLPKSLLGSLAHVKSLALKETEELDFDKVEADWELAFDELFEKGWLPYFEFGFGTGARNYSGQDDTRVRRGCHTQAYRD
ncbi:hypothetical protein BSKO_12586 [Bryopsis sp. KO-2023]|nr:hypothetical protein BSKO_12586 [Bryopsis sp. KO-2023]